MSNTTHDELTAAVNEVIRLFAFGSVEVHPDGYARFGLYVLRQNATGAWEIIYTPGRCDPDRGRVEDRCVGMKTGIARCVSLYCGWLAIMKLTFQPPGESVELRSDRLSYTREYLATASLN